VITITLDLSRMTADQIAMLDATLTKIRQVPSKTRNEIINAGHANCGAAEYESLYIKFSNALEFVK